jgi:hypothetical protein
MNSEPGAPGPKVFISYRREDTAGHAGRLFDAITARYGDRHVFMDVDLAPGVDFAERITETIGASDVLLVIIGPRWTTVARDGGEPRLSDPRDYVRLEVETALQQPRVKVIPVLVAGAQMPTQEELPESLQPLRRRNALELSDARWRYDVGRLVNSLGGELGGPQPLPTSAPSSPARRRGIAIGAAALGVVVLVVVLAVAGVFSGGGGGGSAANTGSGTAGVTAAGGAQVGADTATHAYELAYEAKDLDALRKLLAPDIVVKQGATSEWHGVSDVIDEYRKEFKAMGDKQPGFDWDVGGSDTREEIDAVQGPYRTLLNGNTTKQGNFGTIARILGSKALITELCFDCPDLHHVGGFIAAGS